MVYAIYVALFNLILIEIFAYKYYYLYFFSLFLFLYMFKNKSNVYQILLALLLVVLTVYLLDEHLFELFLRFDIYRYYIYVESDIIIILSVLHLVLLKYVAYYLDLKNLGYNLTKK